MAQRSPAPSTPPTRHDESEWWTTLMLTTMSAATRQVGMFVFGEARAQGLETFTMTGLSESLGVSERALDDHVRILKRIGLIEAGTEARTFRIVFGE